MTTATLPPGQSTDEGKYAPTKAFLRVYAMLIERASNRATCVYMDVAKLMGITRTGSNMARQTGHMCYEITMRERRYGRPMLSALVVSAGTGMPGKGFYPLAQERGLLPENATDAQKEAFWRAEVDAVYAEWAQ